MTYKVDYITGCPRYGPLFNPVTETKSSLCISLFTATYFPQT